MGMFQKSERSRKLADELRAVLSKDINALTQQLEGLKDHSGEMTAQVSAIRQQNEGITRQLNELKKRVGSLVACPHCGILFDLEKTKTTGGLIWPEAKRCAVCDTVLQET